LYPRPLPTDKIDVAVKPPAVDQLSSDNGESRATSANTKSNEQNPVAQNFSSPQFAPPVPAAGPDNPASPEPPVTSPVVPPGPIVTIPPVILPSPNPVTLLDDVNSLVGNANTWVQSLYGTVNSTVTAVAPKTVVQIATSKVSSVHRKISSV